MRRRKGRENEEHEKGRTRSRRRGGRGAREGEDEEQEKGRMRSRRRGG